MRSSRSPNKQTKRNEKRARKEESYLENEYLRAKRKNLRTPWSAAAIRRRRCGRAEKTQSTERHEEVGTSGCRCRSLATVCAQLSVVCVSLFCASGRRVTDGRRSERFPCLRKRKRNRPPTPTSRTSNNLWLRLVFQRTAWDRLQLYLESILLCLECW